MHFIVHVGFHIYSSVSFVDVYGYVAINTEQPGKPANLAKQNAQTCST